MDKVRFKKLKLGWVYYDNAWQGPHPRITLGSYTRRRCWIRTMECIDGKAKLKQC